MKIPKWVINFKCFMKTTDIKVHVDHTSHVFLTLVSVHTTAINKQNKTGDAPGDAPTTSEWSTILLPTKVRLILEVLPCMWKRLLLTELNLPAWQSSPPNPSTHVQLYLLTKSVQLPEFWQGSLAHSSISTKRNWNIDRLVNLHLIMSAFTIFDEHLVTLLCKMTFQIFWATKMARLFHIHKLGVFWCSFHLQLVWCWGEGVFL